MAGRRATHEVVAAGAAAIVVAVALVLAAPVHVSGGSLALGAECADAAPAQATVNIGMVVDFGILDPGSVAVTCVPVAPGTDGFDMLQLAGHRIRLDSSGLLCAIDDRPATGCGERTANGYRYWAYFHGTGSSWSYSSIGPGGYRAAAGTVDGWHFVEGAGNPSDPPPGRAPTNICPAAPPPTVAPTTAPPPMTTARPVTPAPTPAPAASGGATDPAAAPTPGAGPTTTSTAPGDGPAGAGDGSTATDGAPPGSVVVDGAGSGSSPGSTTIGADGVASDVTVLAAAQSPSPGSDAGAPLATVLVVVAVAGLGGAAAWRFRGRPDPSG